MKIVHLAKFYLPHLGGVEIHLKEINSLLVKMGHQVTVVTTQHDLRLSSEATYNGVKIIRIPKAILDEKSKFAKKKKTWEFIKQHKKLFLEADVVHAHDVFWWILPILKSIRKKTFITFHGWETKYPVKFSAKIQRYIYSKLARGTIHIGAWIKEFYFDKPSFVTYGAINAKRFTKSRVGTNNSGIKNTINISFIGRLSKDNDIEKYIKLIKILKTKGQKVRVVWVGDGEFREKCEKLGSVTGFVKNVSKYLVNKDLVFSSSYLSILEAQLLENNVCAFYSNKLKEEYLKTFPGSEYMLIASSPKSMIKKINLLLGSPKLKRQSGGSASEFAKEQTWQKVLDLYFKLWDSTKKHN